MSKDLLESLSSSDRIWHLSRASIVKGLSEEDLEAVSGSLQDHVFAQGGVIFSQHDPAESLYVLNRGCVRLSIIGESQREKTVEILRGGDIFGLEAIGHSGSYQVQAIAHEESWISILTREKFLQLARERPSLSYNLIQILLERLAEAHDDIKSLCFLDIQQRLVRTLLKLGEKHGQRIFNQDHRVRLKLRLSHDYLARLTGANRPYLSNIMSTFKKKGWIEYQRKHLIIDVEALNALAGGTLSNGG